MQRISPVHLDATEATTAATLKAVKNKLGMLPNLFSTLANSSVALNGFIQLSETLGRGRLTARQRETIALAVAEENACEYCVSAHAALGKSVGLSEEDIQRARHGGAVEALDDAATHFALLLVRSRADISDGALKAAREAGLDDGLIAEIVANVALHTLSNYFNRVAATEVDFPLVALSSVA